MFNWLFHLMNSLLLVVVLIFVVLIYRNQSREKFANCFGAQYDGLNFLNDKNAPVCPQGFRMPYRTGGCAEYDPQKVSVAYATGDNNFIPAV